MKISEFSPPTLISLSLRNIRPEILGEQDIKTIRVDNCKNGSYNAIFTLNSKRAFNRVKKFICEVEFDLSRFKKATGIQFEPFFSCGEEVVRLPRFPKGDGEIVRKIPTRSHEILLIEACHSEMMRESIEKREIHYLMGRKIQQYLSKHPIKIVKNVSDVESLMFSHLPTKFFKLEGAKPLYIFPNKQENSLLLIPEQFAVAGNVNLFWETAIAAIASEPHREMAKGTIVEILLKGEMVLRRHPDRTPFTPKEAVGLAEEVRAAIEGMTGESFDVQIKRF
jgi:hypothetical protein